MNHPSEKKKVLIIGPNLTLQQVHHMPSIGYDSVNRATSTKSFASGKGSNVARAVRQLGQESTLLSFVGSGVGEILVGKLIEEGIKFHSVPMKSMVRISSTIFDEQLSAITEVIAQSPSISAEEEETYFQNAMSLIQSDDFDSLVITGKSPMLVGRAPVTERILRDLKVTKKPVLIDLTEDFLSTLDFQPNWLLKVNVDEFDRLYKSWLESGMDLPSPDDIPGPELDEMVQAAPIARLCVTDSDCTAYIKWDGNIHNVTPEFLENHEIVNTIGAGDVACAALSIFLTLEESPGVALEKALRYASASCKTILPGDFLNHESPML